MSGIKNTNWRHGDICGISIISIPKELKASETKILLQIGSSGHPHSFDNGTFYSKEDGQIIGFLEAKNTMLFHSEHSPNGGRIDDGIYEIRRQQEWTHEGFKKIID